MGWLGGGPRKDAVTTSGAVCYPSRHCGWSAGLVGPMAARVHDMSTTCPRHGLVGGAGRRGARAEARMPGGAPDGENVVMLTGMPFSQARLPEGAARVRPLPIRRRGTDGDGRRLGRDEPR